MIARRPFVVAMAACLPLSLAAEEQTPEGRLVAALVSLRRSESKGGSIADRAHDALAAYRAAANAMPDSTSARGERVKRFERALKDAQALTECERLHFSEVGHGQAPDTDTLLGVLLKLLAPDEALYQSPLMSGRGQGVFVFCGDAARSVTPAALAQRFAPAVWFSYDEPLLLEGQTIPQALPGGRKGGDGRVAYYQVTSGTLLQGGRKGPWSDETADDGKPLDLNAYRNHRLKIRYFFYYPRDTGTNGHTHDVEGAEIFVRVIDWPLGKSTGDGDCVRVVPEQVRGLAHGLMWAANNLVLKKGAACDTALPFTLLVEEGKHASCPDRDGDGLYTPGYDVNFWVHEAWGLRDDFGAARVHSRYMPESAKPRKRPNLVLPPFDLKDVPDEDRRALKQLYCTRTSTPVAPGQVRRGEARTDLEEKKGSDVSECVDRWDRQTYELRGAVGIWPPADPKHFDPLLDGKLSEQEFGRLWPWYRTFFNKGLREYVGFEVTSEDGHFLLLPQITPFKRGLPLVDGWLTVEPGFALHGNGAFRRLGLTYSRSASRPLDWYFTLNFKDFKESSLSWEGGWPNVRLHAQPELGLKLRYQVDQVFGKVPVVNWLRKVEFFWHSFMGVRLGVEAVPDSGSGRTFRIRWTFGTGAW